jgi:ubiquinone biosynthesis protein UbiJ
LDDLREKIQGNENAFEKLLRKIPGFAGYQDREQRRAADRMQRSHIAETLTQERSRLDDVGAALLNKGGLQLMDDLDRVRSQFDRVIERVRHASEGYGGFFDAVRINEAELDRVYEFDLALLSQVSSIGEAITAVEAAESDTFADRLKSLDQQVKALDQKLDERTRTMMGVS